MKTRLVVTTSWDDGHPADIRLAELLAKHGVAGTFYVPSRNSEGRPVMNEREIRTLSRSFELAGHSSDHVVLTNLSHDEAQRQIGANKEWLESVTGGPVQGFCYVRGRYDRAVKHIVQRLGFAYARTTANLHSGITTDPFALPTTVQFFPHHRTTLLSNFARGGFGWDRARLLWSALSANDLVPRIERLIGACQGNGGYFHLWGHSWEIEKQDLWKDLETILRHLRTAGPVDFLTNYEALMKLTPPPPGPFSGAPH